MQRGEFSWYIKHMWLILVHISIHSFSHHNTMQKCYDEKGVEAADGMDNDMRPWLKSFVESVGSDKAKQLLAGAGNFVSLSNA